MLSTKGLNKNLPKFIWKRDQNWTKWLRGTPFQLDFFTIFFSDLGAASLRTVKVPLPHVTTRPSERIAAKACSADWICCTSWSWAWTIWPEQWVDPKKIKTTWAPAAHVWRHFLPPSLFLITDFNLWILGFVTNVGFKNIFNTTKHTNHLLFLGAGLYWLIMPKEGTFEKGVGNVDMFLRFGNGHRQATVPFFPSPYKWNMREWLTLRCRGNNPLEGTWTMTCCKRTYSLCKATHPPLLPNLEITDPGIPVFPSGYVLLSQDHPKWWLTHQLSTQRMSHVHHEDSLGYWSFWKSTVGK